MNEVLKQLTITIIVGITGGLFSGYMSTQIIKNEIAHMQKDIEKNESQICEVKNQAVSILMKVTALEARAVNR
jgi:hypothetical protein